jgi:hypothetical protein
VLIPAIAGLVGALIGGGCTIWAARYQFTLQARKEQLQRDEQVARKIKSFRLRIDSLKKLDASALAELSKCAFEIRTLFIDNPDQLLRTENQEFFDEYLAEAANPSEAYWTDERVFGFVSDAKKLAPNVSR